jgi:membrane protein insertase Oxa1/YidC/SpoIIIJ
MDTNDFEAVVDKDDTKNYDTNNLDSNNIKNNEAKYKKTFEDIKNYIPDSAKALTSISAILIAVMCVIVIIAVGCLFLLKDISKFIIILYGSTLFLSTFIVKAILEAIADNVIHNARTQKLIELQTKMML